MSSLALIPSPVDIANQTFMAIDPDIEIWQHLPHEPEKWHERFCVYLSIDSFERSIIKVYNRDRLSNALPPKMSLPPEWNVMSQAWRWKNRAMAYDRHQEEMTARRREQNKQKSKERRMSLLDAFEGKVLDSIDFFDPQEHAFRLSEVTAAVKALGSELRTEHNDEPVKKSEVSITSMAALLKEAEKLKYSSNYVPDSDDDIIDAEFS